MEKYEWESLYRELDRIYSDFLMAYPRYEQAKDEATRAEAEKNVHEAIESVMRNLKLSDELKDVMIGKNAAPGYETYYYEDFIKPEFFKNDMAALLDKIRSKIAML